jgi:hypothetical protein
MSGAHEGCSQGKSVRDREGSKHSTHHCGHSGKSGQRGRRVATGLRGYGACEAAEGVVQKSGAKDESSRSGTLAFNGIHASERGAAARKVEWGPALREFENFVGSRILVSHRRATRHGSVETQWSSQWRSVHV